MRRRVNVAAASRRPSALTSDASSAVIVTGVSGADGRAASCSVRSATSSRERVLREWRVRLERRRVAAHQAARRDELDLRLRPGRLRRAGGEGGEASDEAEQRQENVAAHLSANRPAAAERFRLHGWTSRSSPEPSAEERRAILAGARSGERTAAGVREPAGARRRSTIYATARLRRRAGATPGVVQP